MADTDYTILERVKSVIQAVDPPIFAEVVIGTDAAFMNPQEHKRLPVLYILWAGTPEAPFGTEDHSGHKEATVNIVLVMRTKAGGARGHHDVNEAITVKNASLNAIYADPTLTGASDGTRAFTSWANRAQTTPADGILEQMVECEARFAIENVTAR